MKLLTLMIPTYNRPSLLERILDYYNLYKVDFNILVGDSSIPANKKLNRNIIQSFPNLNILYLDKFPEKLVSHRKFAKMVNYVKTKYCVFCADDDFIVPNGIKEAVDFLEKNPDYSAAHGSYISFYVFSNPLGPKKFWWNFIYPYRSITYQNAEDRLAAHPTDCQQVLYAVRKTDIVKTCYRELLKSQVDPLLFGERLPDVLTVISGKMKRLNNFYAARQAFSTSYIYWPDERDAIKAGTFEGEYIKFKNSIIFNLVKISKIPKEEASRIIDLNMEKYIQSSWQQHLVARVNLMLKHFPVFISKLLRIMHAKYLFSKDKKDRVGPIDNPTSKYFNDFDSIRKLVLGHL